MENLEKKLLELQDLIKKAQLMPSPKMPKVPGIAAPAAPQVKAPTMAPPTNKDPMKVAQQIQDAGTKKLAVKQAKQMLKTDKNGQWSLT